MGNINNVEMFVKEVMIIYKCFVWLVLMFKVVIMFGMSVLEVVVCEYKSMEVKKSVMVNKNG